MINHPFTPIIIAEVDSEFSGLGTTIFELSPLIQYINHKTRSANRGSKSRSSFANLYALYVLVEDYVNGGHVERGDYEQYSGAEFTPLLRRMRELPFGSKLQNHALNSRANDEFHKYFPHDDRRPILRDVASRKYWINEALLTVPVAGRQCSLAKVVIRIIDRYVETKRESFAQFIGDCERLNRESENATVETSQFIRSLLAPERDARLFEIASYAILKAHYETEIVFIGQTRDTVEEEPLHLFKTGRTNANDGGIDFVMKPLGRFFQVTETLDVKKYFLDVDKVERYPISFVVKSELATDEIKKHLEQGAKEQYGILDIVKRYMDAVEEIINIPILRSHFDNLAQQGRVAEVLEEIVQWSKLEFNIEGSPPSLDSVADDDEDMEE